jgi:putative RNA 2'-phosphotransferase
MRGRVKISKLMSYILRHNPMSLRMGRDGSVYVGNLLSLMQKKYPWLDGKCLEEIVREDEKGRYELKGSKIRARYGHSIDVAIDLPLTDLETLYHGTSNHLAKEILKEGLKSMRRKKVHLSKRVEDAVEVGKRRTANPVILKVDAGEAASKGIRIERATDRIYVADPIPKKSLSLHKGKS